MFYYYSFCGFIELIGVVGWVVLVQGCLRRWIMWGRGLELFEGLGGLEVQDGFFGYMIGVFIRMVGIVGVRLEFFFFIRFFRGVRLGFFITWLFRYYQIFDTVMVFFRELVGSYKDVFLVLEVIRLRLLFFFGYRGLVYC